MCVWGGGGVLNDHVHLEINIREYSSPGSTFCADLLLQQHLKHFSHSAKSAGGMLQQNAHTPYTCNFK